MTVQQQKKKEMLFSLKICQGGALKRIAREGEQWQQ